MDGKRQQRAASAVEARLGELDMTQQELAEAARIDVKTIGNLKRGRWPIARTRARIEKALGWPAGELERIASEEPGEEDILPPGLRDEINEAIPDPERRARFIALAEAYARGEPLTDQRRRAAGR